MEEKNRDLKQRHPRTHNSHGHKRPQHMHSRPVHREKIVKNEHKTVKTNKQLDKNKIIKILSFVFAGLAHVTFLLIVFWSVKFSSIAMSGFVFLYIALALLLIIDDIVLFVSYKYHDFIIRCISCFLSIMLLIGGIFGSTVVGKLSNTAGKVTQNNSKVQYETVNAVVAVYENDNIKSLSDLNNKTVGVVKSSTEKEDTTTVGKKKLEKDGVTVTYKEYESLVDLYMGLILKEVDAAILPSSYQSLLSQNSGFEDSLKKVRDIDSTSAEVETGESSGYSKDITKEPFTVLLIGYAQESENYGLADSVILCSVNPITYQVAMVSLARDSYVPICGGGSDKLTHARGQSRACLIQTVEDLMDEKVDFYAEVNFQGIVDIVDALGGITINNPVEFVGQSPDIERGNMTVLVPAGEIHADGAMALAFARERHAFAAGDFARQQHQQEVIKAICEKIFELKDVNKALNVIEAAGNNLSTNFSINQLTSLFNYVMKNGANTGVSVMNQIQIFNSRVTGYSSWHWNDAAKLALWIYRLWNGSIKDNKWLIDKVMGTEDVKEQKYKLTFRWNAPFEEYYVFPDTYNEEQIHEQLPTTMPNLIGMTLEEAQTWANGAGVTLSISYVETTDTTLVGKVKSQSVEQGTNLDDCGHLVSIEVYSLKSTKIKIPTFTSVEEVETWAKTNELVFKTDVTKTTDKELDGKYAGTNPAAGEEIVKGATIIALTYKYDEVEPTPEQKACEDSGGTWKSGVCSCPSGYKLVEGRCQKEEPEPSGDEKLCKNTGGTWDASSKTCSCGEGKQWEAGKGCVEPTPHTHEWVTESTEEANCKHGKILHQKCKCGETQDITEGDPIACKEGEECQDDGTCKAKEQNNSVLFGIYKKNAKQIHFSNYKSSINKKETYRIW